MIIRPHVDRQFLDLLEVDAGVTEQLGRCFPKERERPLNHLFLRPDGKTAAADEDRHRTVPLVLVRLPGVPRFQQGHGPVPDKIVEIANNPAGQA